MLDIQLPDGTIVSHPDDATPLSVAEKIGSRLAKAVIAAKVGETIVDAGRSLKSFANGGPIPVRLLTEKDPESLEVLRHSCAHVMARAIMRLYPNVSLAFGPTITNGYYYDFDLPQKLNEDDFAKIEAEMAKLVEMAEPFEQFSLDRPQAVELCTDMKQSLKVEHIQTGLSTHETLG
ncbi:MAG: TGS domain-containing protein, partial [Pirellula sp.]